MPLLDELKAAQGDRSLWRFAHDLGLTYSTMWRIMHGQSGISRKVAHKICERAPELAWAVAQHFVGKRAA